MHKLTGSTLAPIIPIVGSAALQKPAENITLWVKAKRKDNKKELGGKERTGTIFAASQLRKRGVLWQMLTGLQVWSRTFVLISCLPPMH